MTVFRDSVAKVMSLLNQLHPNYHTERQIRDLLPNAVDLPHIQLYLHYRTPRMSQQIINLVPSRLFTSKKTAGASSVHIAEDTKEWSDADDEGAF